MKEYTYTPEEQHKLANMIKSSELCKKDLSSMNKAFDECVQYHCPESNFLSDPFNQILMGVVVFVLGFQSARLVH